MTRGTEELRTFNCWIVLVNEVTLDKLNSEARLSYTTASDNDQFIFSKKLFFATISSSLGIEERCGDRGWTLIIAGSREQQAALGAQQRRRCEV
jgi:hypothetical protein